MKKRILSSLLAFVMLLSALPMGVYAAETRYSVAASPDQTTDVGKTVSMTVSVAGGSYNAYDLAMTYDTARLTYVSGQAADKGASVTEKSGSIRVIGYGADKAASTAAVTLTFKTKAAGSAEVRISSAKIDAGANAPTKDAPLALTKNSTTRFTIQPGYTVTLEDGLTADSLSAAAGEDYYTRMAAAWLFAEGLTWQYERFLPWLTDCRLPPEVHRMTVRKALDSYRVPAERKAVIRRTWTARSQAADRT